MRQQLIIPPIVLDWTAWVPWRDLARSTASVPTASGVYEVRRGNEPESAKRLHIGKATKVARALSSTTPYS